MDYSSILADVVKHGNEVFPSEACGVVVIFKGRMKYVPCNNLLQGDAFCIDPADYARAEDMGEIVAIAHTHPAIPAEPSNADIVACDRSGLEWLIVSIPDESFTITQPKEFNIPLVGRQFYHGVLDCYSLIRDYYSQELNISLNDYIREPEWWNTTTKDLYVENFQKEGFVEVDSLQKHDIVLMQHGSDKINHGAVYLGDSIMIHHSTNRLSSRDVYGGYWRKNTRKILRHRSLL